MVENMGNSVTVKGKQTNVKSKETKTLELKNGHSFKNVLNSNSIIFSYQNVIS